MNISIRLHPHYAKAALYYDQALASSALMMGFSEAMRQYYDHAFGGKVEPPSLDIVARAVTPDYMGENRMPAPTQRQATEARQVAASYQELVPLMEHYAIWQRTARRVLDEAYAKRFGLKSPGYDVDDHLRSLQQLVTEKHNPSAEVMLDDLTRAANRAIQYLDLHMQTEPEPPKMCSWQDAVCDDDVRGDMRRQLFDGRALHTEWDYELWGWMSNYCKSHPNVDVQTEDALSAANRALMTQSAEFGDFYPARGSAAWVKKQHALGLIEAKAADSDTVDQRMKDVQFILPRELKDKAAGMVILEQALASLTMLSERLLPSLGSVPKGKFDAAYRDMLSHAFDQAFYNDQDYSADPYLPKSVSPTGEPEVGVDAQAPERITLQGWLAHLAHDHVKDDALGEQLMDELKRMHREARTHFLEQCEMRVNGVSDSRSVR